MSKVEMAFGYANERTTGNNNKTWDIVDMDDKKYGELTRSDGLGVWMAKSATKGAKMFTDQQQAILHIIGSDLSKT